MKQVMLFIGGTADGERREVDNPNKYQIVSIASGRNYATYEPRQIAGRHLMVHPTLDDDDVIDLLLYRYPLAMPHLIRDRYEN